MANPTSITFITGQLGLGGAEKQLYLLVRGLTQSGWRVSVITLNPGVGDYWEKPIKELGIPLYEIPRTALRLGRLALIQNVLAKEKPQIVHAWTLHANIYAALAGRLAGIPVRTGSERANQNISRQALGRWWYFCSLRGLTCLVANSEPAATYMRRYHRGLDAKVVPNAVEIPEELTGSDQRNEIRRRLGITATSVVIGAVGSLVPRKNFALLIDAIASLSKEFPDIMFVLVGQGLLRQDLEQRARASLPRDGFLFTGAIPNASELYPAFDLLCSPSLNQEGMPNVLMEASAAGLPVVATNVGGVSQIVEDGKTGFLVQPGDMAAMRDRIRQLVVDAELRHQLGNAGREKMQREYGVERMVTRMMAVYRTTLEAKGIVSKEPSGEHVTT